MSKRAFITGIAGQDGSLLAENLLGKGYEVAGLSRQNDLGIIKKLGFEESDIKIYKGDLQDEDSIREAILDFAPDEIYNLAAEAAPPEAFKERIKSTDINVLGALRVFQAALDLKKQRGSVKVFQASSSEMYGVPKIVPQNENTPFDPQSPYAIGKLAAHFNARSYRESSEKLFISCGILFSHESERRGLKYVSRKISVGVACIANGVKELPLNEFGDPILNQDRKLVLGSLDRKKDWGYAPEYIEGMWLTLQQPEPDDFVFATGEMHSVEEYCEEAFKIAGLNYKDHIETDPKFLRDYKEGSLCGDSSKAKRLLGWEAKVKFGELVKFMVEADLKLYKN